MTEGRLREALVRSEVVLFRVPLKTLCQWDEAKWLTSQRDRNRKLRPSYSVFVIQGFVVTYLRVEIIIVDG